MCNQNTYFNHMTSIVFGNGKGGVGKSTLSLGVALALAVKGFKIAARDTDSQNSFTNSLQRIAGTPGASNITDYRLNRPVHLTICDGPPRVDQTERAFHDAMRTATMACFPCGPSFIDLWSTKDSVDALKPMYPKAQFVVVLNQIDRRTAMSRIIRQKIQMEMPSIQLLDTEIPRLACLTNLSSFGWDETNKDAREALFNLALELKSRTDALISTSVA
jgi:chromosome partitioning protein